MLLTIQFIVGIGLIVSAFVLYIYQENCGMSDYWSEYSSYSRNVNNSWVRFNSYAPTAWFDFSNGDPKELTYTQGSAKFNVSERTINQYVIGAEKWSDLTQEKIKATKTRDNRSELQVEKVCYAGRKTYKVMYKVPTENMTVEQYFMKQSDTRALFISVYYNNQSDAEKRNAERDVILKSAELLG